MKKILVLSLALLLALTLAVPCAQAEPEDLIGKTWDDFTVKTLGGESFTLSESLKDHDLVLINFWATWCGPCCYEFPFLEEAWEQYSDRVDVVALSVESGDSDSVLTDFAKEYGLKFRLGRDEQYLYSKTDSMYIPTTLIVDKNLRVVYVTVGAASSAEEFTGLFDSLLSPAT